MIDFFTAFDDTSHIHDFSGLAFLYSLLSHAVIIAVRAYEQVVDISAYAHSPLNYLHLYHLWASIQLYMLGV